MADCTANEPLSYAYAIAMVGKEKESGLWEAIGKLGVYIGNFPVALRVWLFQMNNLKHFNSLVGGGGGEIKIATKCQNCEASKLFLGK